ncbi:TIGR00341 family protein [Patescibacteria group bacterium]|nr:TIGR00341 family protein [Patescibacteria group bacterium]
MPNPFTNYLEKTREKKELKTAIELLVTESTLTPKFIILTIISSLLAALGVMMNNTPILIGSMVVAPLLIPVLSLSVGLGAGSVKLIGHSLKSLSIGFALSLLTAAYAAWLFKPAGIDPTLYASYANQDLYSIVAFASGILAVYSWFRSISSAVIPAVAIAVSLVPPLAFLGVLIPLNEQKLLIDTLELLSVNLIGILLGGLFTFLIIRLLQRSPNSEVDKEVEKGIEKNGKP